MANESENSMSVVFEKARVNVFNIAGFVIVIAVNAFGLGVAVMTFSSALAQNEQRVEALQTTVKDIQNELPTISQLQYQMTNVSTRTAENTATIEENEKQANDRIDRVVESFAGKLDTIAMRVNEMATNVEVLATRLNQDRERQEQ